MSKMTQRRMNRRASRKLAEAGRRERRQGVEIRALSSNLKSAFKAIEAQRDTIRELKKSQSAASPAVQ